jgi:hypothetical protein
VPSSPYWKLRRLAPRAKRILERRAPEAPAFVVYAETLPAKADAFMKAYDAAQTHQDRWRKELAEGRGAIDALHKAARVWLPALVRDVPGFDAASFAAGPSVPDDVLNDADRLLGVLEDARRADGSPLPYREVALDQFEALFRAAQTEWQEAEAADRENQALLAASRAAGDAFDAELQLFRRAFQARFGRRDRDFQRLRAERAAQPDPDDDPAAPPPPGAVAAGPAPVGEGAA